MNLKFSYPSEKFSAARRCLMLPHTHGETEDIANAFHECSLGLHDLDHEKLDDHSSKWVNKIRELMDTSVIQDRSGRGKWLIKAEQLTEEQKIELSKAVDELANWFDRQLLGE
jgi:hypothetical protein